MKTNKKKHKKLIFNTMTTLKIKIYYQIYRLTNLRLKKNKYFHFQLCIQMILILNNNKFNNSIKIVDNYLILKKKKIFFLRFAKN